MVLFTGYIHHLSLCVLLVSQNLYVNDTLYRELNKNASYYIIFDNIRARLSLKILSRHLFDDNKFLNEKLEKERKKNPYAHLIIDLSTKQKEILHVRTGWLHNAIEDIHIYAP